MPDAESSHNLSSETSCSSTARNSVTLPRSGKERVSVSGTSQMMESQQANSASRSTTAANKDASTTSIHEIPPDPTRLSAIETLLAQLTEKQENAPFISRAPEFPASSFGSNQINSASFNPVDNASVSHFARYSDHNTKTARSTVPAYVEASAMNEQEQSLHGLLQKLIFKTQTPNTANPAQSTSQFQPVDQPFFAHPQSTSNSSFGISFTDEQQQRQQPIGQAYNLSSTCPNETYTRLAYQQDSNKNCTGEGGNNVEASMLLKSVLRIAESRTWDTKPSLPYASDQRHPHNISDSLSGSSFQESTSFPSRFSNFPPTGSRTTSGFSGSLGTAYDNKPSKDDNFNSNTSFLARYSETQCHPEQLLYCDASARLEQRQKPGMFASSYNTVGRRYSDARSAAVVAQDLLQGLQATASTRPQSSFINSQEGYRFRPRKPYNNETNYPLEYVASPGISASQLNPPSRGSTLYTQQRTTQARFKHPHSLKYPAAQRSSTDQVFPVTSTLDAGTLNALFPLPGAPSYPKNGNPSSHIDYHRNQQLNEPFQQRRDTAYPLHRGSVTIDAFHDASALCPPKSFSDKLTDTSLTGFSTRKDDMQQPFFHMSDRDRRNCGGPRPHNTAYGTNVPFGAQEFSIPLSSFQKTGYDPFPAVPAYPSNPQRRRSGRNFPTPNNLVAEFHNGNSQALHTTRLYKLSLCLPITIPYGTVHVTKASGENFYAFSDTTRCADASIRNNAEMLFSPSKGICDAWASFLQIRTGSIFRVEAEHITYVIDLFHAVLMAKTDFGGPLIFDSPIKLYCKGLYVSAPQNDAGFASAGFDVKPKAFPTNHPNASGGKCTQDKRLETRAFFEDPGIGWKQFQHLCAQLQLFKCALQAVNPVEGPREELFPENVQQSIARFKKFLSERLAKTPKQAGRKGLPISVPVVHLASLFTPRDETAVPTDFQGLPVIVREYGQVENKELEESFIRNPLFAEDHKVPGIQVAEIRIEHQSKKMVDPRFSESLVLTRQMAGDENPQQWNETKKKTLHFSASDDKIDEAPRPELTALNAKEPNTVMTDEQQRNPPCSSQQDLSEPLKEKTEKSDMSLKEPGVNHDMNADTAETNVNRKSSGSLSSLQAEMTQGRATEPEETQCFAQLLKPGLGLEKSTTGPESGGNLSSFGVQMTLDCNGIAPSVDAAATQAEASTTGLRDLTSNGHDIEHQENPALSVDAERPSFRVGRHEFCKNIALPAVKVEYRDAKDCFSSTHGFIYLRHVLAQQQRRQEA